MAKVLLINPSYESSYGNAKAGIINPVFPTLGLMSIAAMALKRGHKVEVLDLSYRVYNYKIVKEKVETFRPDFVGVTATTPLMNQAKDISVLIKDHFPHVTAIIGGAHASALPKETLLESRFDIATVGESDYTFADIVDGNSWESIQGIYYNSDGQILSTPLRGFVSNLDELPLPALHLYDPLAYKGKVSKLYAKRFPFTALEFSRGCVYKCDFCASKNTMALGYRKKSPERCAEEVKFLHRMGYREFLLTDDIFTSDNNWACQVSQEIAKANVDVMWTCTNGIRVDSANDHLFTEMRKAKCYRVAFGLESGNDRVLKQFGKGGRATIEQADTAIHAVKKAGIEAIGYFMLGLSADDESSMMDTIQFAKVLKLDSFKFGKAIAFPGTAMFNAYKKLNLIKSYYWDDYSYFSGKDLFVHPKLSNELIEKYIKFAYKEALLKNPKFIIRRMIRGVRTGEFFWDIYYFLIWIFSGDLNQLSRRNIYYNEKKWPSYDFKNNVINIIPVRTPANKIAAM